MPPSAAMMFMRRRWLVALGIASLPCARLIAQTAVQSDPTGCLARATEATAATAPNVARSDSVSRRSSADSSKSPVAVMILASASASEVTFLKQPELRVRLCGGLDSVHVVERRNLPSPVVTGRTYRDVYVAVEIFGRLNADCITAALTRTVRDSTARPDACASLELHRSTTLGRPPDPKMP